MAKETLRIDPPASESLNYEAKEDLTICGVHIPQGTEIQYDILG